MKKKVLVTGGCGFIGTNTCLAFDAEGYNVLALDNFSRPTSSINAEELNSRGTIEVFSMDVRDSGNIESLVMKFQPDLVIHLAAQVAVTTSLESPKHDFESNVVGTINLLEGLRKYGKARVIFSSTNKVYGNLDQENLIEHTTRYEYASVNHLGTNEQQEFDPHSPYGCSKGAADKYMTDYHRSFGLDSVVLRQSCIYGERQFGIEDQGWIAWFMISALKGKGVTIYGNGKQVRDALFVDDLCELYLHIGKKVDLRRRVFNVGGGIKNSISVIELLEWLRENLAQNLNWAHGPERLGDQKIFISNNSALEKEIGWQPKTPLHSGLRTIWNWLEQNIKGFNVNE